MSRGWGAGTDEVRKCRADRQLLRCGAERRGLVPGGARLARAGDGAHDKESALQPALRRCQPLPHASQLRDAPRNRDAPLGSSPALRTCLGLVHCLFYDKSQGNRRRL